MAKRKGIDFPGMLAAGENPKGFVGQNANGTTRTGEPGWNKDRWDWEEPMLPREGAWKGDRTGE